MKPTKFDRADAAVCLQRRFRGNQARKNIKTQPVGPGVIHVKIHGGEDTFCRVGIDLEARRDEHDRIIPRTLDILSVDPRLYRTSMVGGDRHFNPISSDNQARKELLGGSPCNVFITGGNFNTLASGKTFEGHPPHRPIGPTKTKQTGEFVPTPKEYESDYTQIFGDDASFISVAPILSKGGKSAFQKPELEKFKFNYENVRQDKAPMYPGFLFHASDRNPRAAFSSPEPSGAVARSDSPDVLTPKQDRLRLATVTTKRPRGRGNDGFRMDEWAAGMARLSRMDEHPGYSYNCDGGGSVVLGVTNQEGELTFSVAQAPTGRPVSTLLALRHGKPDGRWLRERPALHILLEYGDPVAP